MCNKNFAVVFHGGAEGDCTALPCVEGEASTLSSEVVHVYGTRKGKDEKKVRRVGVERKRKRKTGFPPRWEKRALVKDEG